MVIDALLKSLSKRFRTFFGNGLYFQKKTTLVIESQGQEDVTINGYRTKATPWFDNIYLNIKIVLKYCDNHNDFEPYVSVVFFKKVDSNLQPLFRAEWDSYTAIEGYNHPQPHWHIVVREPKEVDTFDSFEQDNEDAGDFAELFAQSEDVEADIYKMHFAMAGDWVHNGNMITELKNEDSLVEWIYYLLTHVRKEFEYVKNKSYSPLQHGSFI